MFQPLAFLAGVIVAAGGSVLFFMGQLPEVLSDAQLIDHFRTVCPRCAEDNTESRHDGGCCLSCGMTWQISHTAGQMPQSIFTQPIGRPSDGQDVYPPSGIEIRL